MTQALYQHTLTNATKHPVNQPHPQHTPFPATPPSILPLSTSFSVVCTEVLSFVRVTVCVCVCYNSTPAH